MFFVKFTDLPYVSEIHTKTSGERDNVNKCPPPMLPCPNITTLRIRYYRYKSASELSRTMRQIMMVLPFV